MIDWLVAQAIKMAVSMIVAWLQKNGYTDAAEALSAKAAHEIVQEVKDMKSYPDYNIKKNEPFS